MTITTRTLRITTTLAATVLVGTLVPSAANAASSTVGDRRGDAPAAVDITQLRLVHGHKRVTGTMTIPKLQRRKLAATELTLKPRGTGRWAYHVGASYGRQGKVRGRYLVWMRGDDPISSRRVPCRGIRSSAKNRKVQVSVPTRCLTKSAAGSPLKGQAQILARIGPGHDSWDEVTRYTPWVRKG